MRTVVLLALCAVQARAQIDTSLLKPVVRDSARGTMNMDALYARPFLTGAGLPVSLGGYMEANWRRVHTDGVTAGDEFQFRRATLFVASSIADRVRFITELEFEKELEAEEDDATGNGTEVEIEYAALDVLLHPLVTLRGGIVVNPIGAFNQNHDGPRWEFVERPVAMEQLLPDTWSSVGVGAYGKRGARQGRWLFGYEAYLTGGFDGSIIDNGDGRTSLPASKDNPSRFGSSASGRPMFTGRVSVKHTAIGELGLSTMHNVYNQFRDDDGNRIDDPRALRVNDVDLATTIPHLGTSVTGEWAWIHVDVPATYSQQYGSSQRGGFVDLVQPLLRRSILGWPGATLALAVRLEYVDWNVGRFRENDRPIGDDLWAVTPALSFRPVPQTVIRLNYRHDERRDLFGNPPMRTGGFLLGIATYF